MADAIRKKSLKLKAIEKLKLRAKQPLTNKQFWKLTKRTIAKKGGLTMLKDPDGKVEVIHEKAADLAMMEMAKGFSYDGNGQSL